MQDKKKNVASKLKQQFPLELRSERFLRNKAEALKAVGSWCAGLHSGPITALFDVYTSAHISGPCPALGAPGALGRVKAKAGSQTDPDEEASENLSRHKQVKPELFILRSQSLGTWRKEGCSCFCR
ncbi:hypothetical protein OJAV_G00043150 [Oryzias javanicus]|uniref:Uncharacterized protein n=1 Tax=Oryzias javanicus TaxID=123683 RepID=A0A3S2Q7J6_ORYJA|nr:hypothetical protein OJAV_G00043150 [Oryzias javanicus]